MLDDEHKLSIAVKACDDSAGPDGNVPTLLLFGVISRRPICPTPLPDNTARMRALQAARTGMTMSTVQARVCAALRHNDPACSNSLLYVGDKVLWYRDKPVAKWTGPFIVTSMGGALARINNGDCQITTSIDRLKRYHARETAPPSNNPVIMEDNNTTPHQSVDSTARMEGIG